MQTVYKLTNNHIIIIYVYRHEKTHDHQEENGRFH
jgi:hypothetical protein